MKTPKQYWNKEPYQEPPSTEEEWVFFTWPDFQKFVRKVQRDATKKPVARITKRRQYLKRPDVP